MSVVIDAVVVGFEFVLTWSWITIWNQVVMTGGGDEKKKRTGGICPPLYNYSRCGPGEQTKVLVLVS